MLAMSKLGSKRDRVLERGILKWGESAAAPLMHTVLKVWSEETELALQDETRAYLAARRCSRSASASACRRSAQAALRLHTRHWTASMAR